MAKLTDPSTWLARCAKRRECSEWERLLLILGKDGYERKALVERILAGLPDAQVHSFDAEHITRAKVMEELNAIPFFGASALVVVHQLEAVDSTIVSSLVKYAKNPNPRVILLMEGTSLSGNHALVKAVDAGGLCIQMPELRPWEKEQRIEAWIQQYVSAAGRRIEPAAASLLAKQLGTDKELLSSELDKLLCYTWDDPCVTVQAVSTISACVPVDTVWQLGEAILRRESGRALGILRGLLHTGASYFQLMSQLRAQIHTSFQICSIVSLGGGPQAVGSQFPYMRGKLLERNIQLAQGYGLRRFQLAMLLCNQSDRDAKNSAGPVEVLAETLVIQLCR